MLQDAYFLAKIVADTAENERYFAEICQKRSASASAPGGGSGSPRHGVAPLPDLRRLRARDGPPLPLDEHLFDGADS